MTADHARPTPGWTIAWLGGAVVLAALLFAPVSTLGFCASSVSGDEYCSSASQSVVGIGTTFWLWLGATVAFGIVAWVASHAVWRQRKG